MNNIAEYYPKLAEVLKDRVGQISASYPYEIIYSRTKPHKGKAIFRISPEEIKTSLGNKAKPSNTLWSLHPTVSEDEAIALFRQHIAND